MNTEKARIPPSPASGRGVGVRGIVILNEVKDLTKLKRILRFRLKMTGLSPSPEMLRISALSRKRERDFIYHLLYAILIYT